MKKPSIISRGIPSSTPSSSDECEVLMEKPRCNEMSFQTNTNNEPTILLLGMTYPRVEENQHNFDSIYELVQNRTFSKMEGRDLLRIIQVRKLFNASCYTVSKETSELYEDQHLSADYSNSRFVKVLQSTFGGIQFDQIIMDWFWCPIAWLKERISSQFFTSTLINLITSNVLNGSVYLPFNIVFVEQLIAHQKLINKHYIISYLSRDDNDQSYLWKATETLDANELQIFGKQPDQDIKYCTIDIKNAKKLVDDLIVDPNTVLSHLKKIDNLENIRIIQLKKINL